MNFDFYLMELLNNLMQEHYSWEIVALLLVIVIFFTVQIRYYGVRYRNISRYHVGRRKRILDTPPAVSVVIPMYNDNNTFVESQLPCYLAQDAEGSDFEIVVVYIGSNGDFYDDLCSLSNVYENLTVTKIENNGKNTISNKLSLNIGIKASKYNHILFTTTDCTPTNSRWLHLMRQGFQYGDIVLGYSAMDRAEVDGELLGGALSYSFIRTCRMMESAAWLSAAMIGRGYRGLRTNIGFTKELYRSVKGYNHLNMSIGDDDLFMQKIMKDDNASIVISSRATLSEQCWGGMGWWSSESRTYSATLPLYTQSAKNYISWELTSRVMLFLASLCALIFLPLELKVLVALLLVIRLVVVLLSVKSVAKRLGETKIVGRYLIYDLVGPLFDMWVRRPLRKSKKQWR